jgi:hypothetical protein
MGKVKAYAEEWLERYGNRQGFDYHNLPKLKHMKHVEILNLDAEEYFRLLQLEKEEELSI